MVAVEVQTTWLTFRGKEFCYAIVNDISEKKINEEKLKESERRLKFSFTKSIIVVSAKLKHTQVEVIIEDSGTGIEEDRLKNLWDIGANLNTKGTKGEKGTGLGLILSKEFVEKNGGTIRVESTVGVGSRFIFTLPLAPF